MKRELKNFLLLWPTIFLLFTKVVSAQEVQELTKEINTNYNSGQTFKLKQMFNLTDPKFKNYKLKKVLLFASQSFSGSAQSKAALFVDDIMQGQAQTLSSSVNKLVFSTNTNEALISSFGSLQLKTNGPASIQRIVLKVIPPAMPVQQDQIISKTLQQTFGGENIVPLREVLGLDASFKGRKLKQIRILGSSKKGFGTATLVLDDTTRSTARTLNTSMTEIIFDLPQGKQILGNEIRTVRLELKGNIDLESVAAKIERQNNSGWEDDWGNNNGGDNWGNDDWSNNNDSDNWGNDNWGNDDWGNGSSTTQPMRLDRMVNRTIYSGEELLLRDLFGSDMQTERKLVEEVIITVSSIDSQREAMISLCTKIRDGGNRGPFGGERIECFERQRVPRKAVSIISKPTTSVRFGELFIKSDASIEITRAVVKLK